MAAKRKETRVRRWSNIELSQFANVLVNEDDSFLFHLETRALKKSSNVEIFEDIKKGFDELLALDEVVEKIKKEIGKKYKVQPKIDTSVNKLRIKYKWLKDQWKKYNDRIKSGSGKSSIEEPDWFKMLDPVFTETHAELSVATKGNDIDNSDDDDSSGDENESTLDSSNGPVWSSCTSYSGSHGTEISGDEESESESTSQSTDAGSKQSAEGKSAKKPGIGEKQASSCVKVKPRKRKVRAKSQGQVLHDLSEGIQKMSQSIDKRMAFMINDDKARDEAFIKFHDRQSELNRQHELRMMEVMMRFAQPLQPQHMAHSMPIGGFATQAPYFNPSQGISSDYNSGGTSASDGQYFGPPPEHSYQNL